MLAHLDGPREARAARRPGGRRRGPSADRVEGRVEVLAGRGGFVREPRQPAEPAGQIPVTSPAVPADLRVRIGEQQPRELDHRPDRDRGRDESELDLAPETPAREREHEIDETEEIEIL